MVKPKILQEEPLSLGKVQDVIEASKKKSELSQRAVKTEEYIKEVLTHSSKKLTELENKLKGLNVLRLKPEHIVKIVDLLPSTEEDLSQLLYGFGVNLTKKDQEAIISAVKEI